MVLSPNLFAKFSTRRRQVGLTGSSSVIADTASTRASFHRNKEVAQPDCTTTQRRTQNEAATPITVAKQSSTVSDVYPSDRPNQPMSSQTYTMWNTNSQHTKPAPHMHERPELEQKR